MRRILSNRSAGIVILLLTALGTVSVCPNTAVAQEKETQKKKKVSKGDAAVAKRSGKSYMKLRLFDKAIEQFEIAVEGNPKDAEAQYFLGFLYSNRGLIEEMVQQFEKCLALKKGKKFKKDIEQLRGSWWGRKFNAGVNAMKAQKFSEAIEEFQTADMIIPGRAETYKGLGLCYLNMGQQEAGIEAYLKAVQLDSTDAATHTNLGIAYLNTNKPEEAKQCFQKAHELKPDDLGALEKLALSEQRLGNSVGALEAAEKALKIDPDKLEVLAMAGQMYLVGGDNARAAELMEKVVEQQPDNEAVIFNLAAAYKNLEEFDKAADLFRKTVETNPNDDAAWYQLGLIYDRKEEFDKAIEAFQMAVDLKPTNARGWRALSRVYARKCQIVEAGTPEAKECAKKAEEAFSMAESLDAQESQ